MTLNNYTDREEALLKELQCKFIIFEHEAGENNTPHLQGYIEFDNAKALAGMKLINKRAHWEPAIGNAIANVQYCTKTGDSVFQKGQYGPGQGHRTDLDDIAQQIVDGSTASEIAQTAPATYVRYSQGLHRLELQTHTPKKWRHVEVEVLWGATGTGKTRKAMRGDVFKLNTNTNGKLWFDGYNGESTLLLDDFSGWIRWSDFLTLLDGYPYRCEIKGGFAWAQWERVVITSNYRWQDWYPNITDQTPLKRRLNKIIHFKSCTEVYTEVGGNTGPDLGFLKSKLSNN